MSKILGIDLGTTNSRMAILDSDVAGTDPVVLENSEGARTTPSVVALTKTGERLVGQAAKRQAVTNPQNTIFSVKRFMGRKYDEVREEEHRVPYKIVKAANGDAHIQVQVGGETKTFSPPEISAMILAKLKADAEAKLDEKITRAVITVPAYFNDSQRIATRDAAKIAGLEVVRLLKSPTAALLAYAVDKEADEKIAVYHLGGGTFDFSLFEIGEGVIETKATNGDTRLGGDDWDNSIMEWIFREFKTEKGIDLTKQPDAVQRIKEEAEKAKIALSSAQEYEINLPFVTADQSGPKHIQKKLTRAKFDQLTEPLFERTIAPVKTCLKDAGLVETDIHKLVLAGGMTRMPRVIESARKVVGKEPHKGVNPEDAAAIGAAIQGGVIKGEIESVLLLEATSLTLAVKAGGGVARPWIPRNTTLPTRKSDILSTSSDNQSRIEITVLQGERPLAQDNRVLGSFELSGIPPAPRSKPRIEVAFDLDHDDFLHIQAKDLGTGLQIKTTMKRSGGLTEAEIARAILDARNNPPTNHPATEPAVRSGFTPPSATPPPPPAPKASSSKTETPPYKGPASAPAAFVPQNVFISYSTHDLEYVEQTLAPTLQRAGHLPWYSQSGIRASDLWERTIRQKLDLSNWFIVVVSPNAIKSDWVRTEVHWAIDNRPGRIIPILLEPCSLWDIHMRLGPLQHIPDPGLRGLEKVIALLNHS